MLIPINTKIWIKKKNIDISTFFSTFLIIHASPKIINLFYKNIIFEIEVNKLLKLTENIEKVNCLKKTYSKNYTNVAFNKAFDILTEKGWEFFKLIAKDKNDNFEILGVKNKILIKRL